MPNHTTTQEKLESVIDAFIQQVVEIVEESAFARVREDVMQVLDRGHVGTRGPGRPPGKRGPGRPPGSGADVVSAKREKRPMSAATLAVRKRQGEYMGTLRALKGADRARVKALAKEKGVAEALKLAKEIKAKQAA